MATRHNTSCSGSKLNLRSFKSSEHINEKGDGPYNGFGYMPRQRRYRIGAPVKGYIYLFCLPLSCARYLDETSRTDTLLGKT